MNLLLKDPQRKLLAQMPLLLSTCRHLRKKQHQSFKNSFKNRKQENNLPTSPMRATKLMKRKITGHFSHEYRRKNLN